MGTVIKHPIISRARWRSRHSALRLATNAALRCLRTAGRPATEVDLLINAGIYRDRNLGEPALAALIQDAIGAHPEDPHSDAHGTFSFDVFNGSCGVLTALQIVDGWLHAGLLESALIVAADANPSRIGTVSFPFSPVGAALICRWVDTSVGLGHPSWVTLPGTADVMDARITFAQRRNRLTIDVSTEVDKRFAEASAAAVLTALQKAAVTLTDVGTIIAAPARGAFAAELAARLDVTPHRIVVADDERMHTAALVGALAKVSRDSVVNHPYLLVAAGAGVTAGAAVYLP